VVAFWNKPENEGELPTVTILDCEICEYDNAFGIETLKLKLPKVTLTKAKIADLKRRGLPDRYIEAMTTGKALTVSEEEGERFLVLTRQKMGKGFGMPRLGTILQTLGTLEMMGLGDWSAAFQMKKVMRQIKKGHEITSGPLAGDSRHFLKAKEMKVIHGGLKDKDGAFDAVTQFDLNVLFPFIDPKYFDAKKMEGSLRRVEAWAGPLMMMLREGQVSPYALEMFGTEGRRQRQLVGGFLNRIFAHEDFSPPAPLLCTWNPHSFNTAKMLKELVQLGYNNGLMSGPTARTILHLDDEQEGDLMEKTHKNRKRYTPPFESKQGLVAGGGRPQESPQPVDNGS
jgi:hypothetical protein